MKIWKKLKFNHLLQFYLGYPSKKVLRRGYLNSQKKRAVVPESKKKYRCQVCNQGFQRTSELKDHNYTQHLGGSYSCAECLKSYVNEKGLKYHIKSIHKGEGKCKCTEEGCDWEDKDSGKLHQHLLTAHEIGDPLVCQVILEDGSTCKKVFKNTRSFKTHAAFHLEKSLNVIFVTGTSPLKPTEKCTLEGITKTKMMKPNISVNSVAKHLTWNLN